MSSVSNFHCHSLLYFSTLSYFRYSIKSNVTNFLKIKQDSRRRMDRKLLWVNGITLIIYDCKTWVIFYHRYIKVKVVIFYGFISVHCTDGLNHLEKDRDKFFILLFRKMIIIIIIFLLLLAFIKIALPKSLWILQRISQTGGEYENIFSG